VELPKRKKNCAEYYIQPNEAVIFGAIKEGDH
jgi:hypothetical protein